MRFFLLLIIIALLMGCKDDYQYQLVDKVDLQRFMGDWYVISILPNPTEKNVTNGIESYQLKDDNKIDITYTFFKNSPQGKKKVLTPKAEVYNTTTNAEWRVQFFWPLKFAYLIIWLDDDYQTTAIGVPNRKYAWIMSRNPAMEEHKYQQIVSHLNKLGYNTDKLIKIPQIWE